MALNNLDKVADILPHLPAAGGGGGMAIGGAITGGATPGAILFVGASGLLAQDAAGLSWDDTDNQLLLSGGTAAKPSLSWGDDGTGLYRGALDNINIATAAVARWSVTAAGHLLAATDNVYDIGQSGSLRPRSVFAGTSVNAGTSMNIAGSNTLAISGAVFQYVLANSRFVHQFTRTAPVSGANGFMQFTLGNSTNRTLSTEINNFSWDAHTDTWATGALTTQREFVINAPTIAFAAASIVTNAATFYVSGSPIAGANATITNSWAAWFGAKIRIDGAIALGAGGAATLGATGGSGPTATAQNEWIEVWTQNGKRFIPAWA